MEVDPPRVVTVEHDGATPQVQISVMSQPAAEDDVAMAAQEAQPPPDSSARRVTLSEILSAAVEIAQTHPEPSEAPSVPDARKRKPTKKTVASSNLKEVKMETATKIECHITKDPTAILMQNREGFFVNLEERQMHLNSRSLGCTRKDPTVEMLKLDHVYNAGSPEMPELNEKKFEAEYCESLQPANKTPYDDLSFMEKSKCWSTQFSCRVRVTDGILLKKLDRNLFARCDYLSVVDSQFLATTSLDLYSGTKTESYRQMFDSRPRMSESHMLCAFGVRPLAVQVDATLAYFGLSSKNFNCTNTGESVEFTRKREIVFDRMWKTQLSDDGVFAATSRTDAAVFWRWLAAALPKSLVELLTPPVTASGEVLEFHQFELTSIILIEELLKICKDTERATSVSQPRAQRHQAQAVFVYLDTIRHGRNYTPAKTINELSSFLSRKEYGKKSLKDDSRILYQIQEINPDVTFCPFDQAHDWKAHNRFTITKKLKLFNNFRLIVSGACLM